MRIYLILHTLPSKCYLHLLQVLFYGLSRFKGSMALSSHHCRVAIFQSLVKEEARGGPEGLIPRGFVGFTALWGLGLGQDFTARKTRLMAPCEAEILPLSLARLRSKFPAVHKHFQRTTS